MTLIAFPRATGGQSLVGGDESFSQVPLEQLRAGGVTALIRYITGDGKGLTKDEFQAIIAAGFELAWVMESFEQAASSGYDQGVKEGRAAYAAASAIGWPIGRPGYFVLEDPYPVPQSSWPAVADYCRGVLSIAGERPLPGGYGSGALCA
ncbi:MAG: glycoside hydrolase domain-containing protein, partial [bacterium]